jgi:hypothetical protein
MTVSMTATSAVTVVGVLHACMVKMQYKSMVVTMMMPVGRILQLDEILILW